VVSDNVEAGRLAARALHKARQSANVVILHIPPNMACIDRVNGFREELAKWPKMRILEIGDGKGTTEGSRPVMRELLEKHPTLNAVFAVNDPSALGVISALDAAHRLPEVTVVSVDGSAQGIAAVKAGTLYSTSVQFPREIGRIAAQRFYEYLDGNSVEKNIKVPLELITENNVHAFTGKR
jgi:ribose transport system substrate-binding protein